MKKSPTGRTQQQRWGIQMQGGHAKPLARYDQKQKTRVRSGMPKKRGAGQKRRNRSSWDER